MPFSLSAANHSSPGPSVDPDLSRKILALQEIFTAQQDKIDELDDPLSIFDSHYCQLAQLLIFYPNDTATSQFIVSLLVPVLDSATQTFSRDPRYRNDPRYLKLWLAYAKYCREAEDIFVFLAQEGIAQELATYYEEYAALISERNPKQANAIYLKGIERRAQPLERLKKKHVEFEMKFKQILAPTLPTISNGKPLEVRGYDSKLIHEGDFSFEEIRARHWYAKPKISKPSLNEISKYRLPPKELSIEPPSTRSLPTIQNVENYANVEANRTNPSNRANPIDLDEEDEDDPGLGIAVNPDDLTHINVFKDNTADLREIAKLVKTQEAALDAPPKAASNPNTPKKKSDWLLKDILMSFSPIRKKPHLDASQKGQDENENLKSPPKNRTNLTTKIEKVSLLGSPMKGLKDEIIVSPTEDIRLLPDSIPDIKTDVTMKLNIPTDDNLRMEAVELMDPFDLDFKVAQCEAVLSQIASAIPNLHLRLDEMASGKVKSFEKSLGRDGSGPNHTVSSLRMASGHFFMERKLGEGGYGKVYLAVDLMKESAFEETDQQDNGEEEGGVNESSVNQVAIKIETPASVWESYIIFRIQSHLAANNDNSSALQSFSRHFPKLLSASIYSDVSFVVMDYYEQGSLLGALNVYRQQNVNLDEAVVLFYAAELIKSVLILHDAGILHTDIKLENLLILTPRSDENGAEEWTSIYRRDGSGGWSRRGLVLIDYGRSVDLKLLKDEERTRFRIKSKHFSFNGNPRISASSDISHEMDWYGVADCIHWLLHQKPLQSAKKLPLKRYWQIDLWEPLFDDLLTPPTDFCTAKNKFTEHLNNFQGRLEGWKKTPSLKSLLTRQEIMMYENKK